jgi:hypothetical protein
LFNIYEYYRKELFEELEALYIAFICKNRIFPEIDLEAIKNELKLKPKRNTICIG